MATADQIIDVLDGADRLTRAIHDSLDAGHLGVALEQANLLVSILEGNNAPRCVACNQPLTPDEVESFTSWCSDDAPSLILRFED